MNMKHLHERIQKLEQTEQPETDRPFAYMTDEELERRAGEILARRPADQDPVLSDRPPGPGVLVGHMSDRAVVQRARQIYERRHRRDSEPTQLREAK